ncbi:MAG: hypothetical protein HY040_20225 [Planctomycetes bacterium]|nr:hypothetical protein [Planctomycetota bacterium]
MAAPRRFEESSAGLGRMMLFFLAFLISSAGCTMLVIGAFRFFGRQVSTRKARQVGAVLTALLPVYLLLCFGLNLLDPQSGAYGIVIFCLMTLIDLCIAAYLLRR